MSAIERLLAETEKAIQVRLLGDTVISLIDLLAYLLEMVFSFV